MATFCIEMLMIRFGSNEFCLFRFVWNEEIKPIRVAQIVLYKSFRVKSPQYNLRMISKEEFLKERFVKMFCGN